MKDYVKPELERIAFATEVVANGDGLGDNDGGNTSNTLDDNFG